MGMCQRKPEAEGFKHLSSSDLDALISRITKQNCRPETDTGVPVGLEKVVFQK